MKRHCKKLRWLALSGAFAGCAVMRVDVDVYKGPLANTRQVQMEQLATMAIGAKPLLIELRDKSESDRYRRSGERSHVHDRMGTNYVADYISSHSFNNENANRVNSILSLYKDADNRELTAIIDRIADRHQRHLEASRVFRAPEPTKLKSLVQRIESAVVPEIRNGAKLDTNYPHPQAKPEHLCKLWQAYRDILYRIQRKQAVRTPQGNQHGLWPAGRVFVAHEALVADLTGSPNNPALLAINNAITNIHEGLKAAIAGSNAHFETLRRFDVVEAHAQLLFRNPGSREARDFVREVNQIADSFLTMRGELHAAMLDMLHFVEHYDTYHRQKDPHRRIVLREAARFIAHTINPGWLENALKLGSPPASVAEAQLLRGLLSTSKHGSPLGRLTQRLTSPQSGDAAQTASAVIYLDSFLKNTRDVAKLRHWATDSERAAMVSPRKRRFGLSRVPAINETAGSHSLDETLDLLTIRRSVDSELSEGRLSAGLETLIREYLDLAAAAKEDDPRLVRATQRLLDGSVHFANKLLFLANNNSLINRGYSDSIGLVDGAIGAVKRGLGGGHMDNILNQTKGGEFFTHHRNEVQESYVRLLQSVGNYILIQVDELRQQEQHSRRLTASKGAELHALRHFLDLPPTQVFDRLVETLRASSESTTTRANESKSALAAAKKTGKTKESEWNQSVKAHETAAKTLAEATSANEKLAAATADVGAAFQTVTGDPGARLRAAIVNPGDRTEEQVTQGILDWLNDQIRPVASVNLTNAIPARKIKARNYFQEYQAKTDRNRRESIERLFDKIVQAVRNNHQSVAENLGKAATRVASAQRTLADAAKTKSTAKQAVDAANTAIAKAKTAADVASASKTKAANALAAVLALKTRLLKEVNAATPPSAVHDKLRNLLQADIATAEQKAGTKAAEDAASKKQGNAATLPPSQPAKDALAALDAVNAPMDPLRLDNVALKSDTSNARDVLDALIAALRYQHLQALRSEGESSAAARNIETAIKAAYNQRSNLIHIRPPAAYLRSSFPSTSLQADPGLRWKNMLQEHAMRSAPLFTSLRDIVNPKGKQTARINAEIDKQFWQNINSVRVAGGGNVNYVVAKDDIGNWYVKTYEANPSNIVNSARNLALFLFSAGSAAGVDMLRNQTSGQPTEKGATTLERLLSKSRQVYDDETVADLKETVALLGDEGVHATIPEGWKPLHDADGDKQRVIEEVKSELARAHKSVATKSLDEELKNLQEQLTDAEKAQKDDNAISPAAGRGILSALHEVRRYHGSVIKAIDSLTFLSEARNAFLEEETKNAAAQDKLNALIEASATAEDAAAAQAGIEEQRNLKEAQEERTTAAKTRPDTAEAAIRQAKENITRIVRAGIRRIVESREETVENYERSILFIGEAAKG